MTVRSFVALPERGLLVVAGEDRVGFLQGLVSNDVAKVGPQRAVHAALLTAQGRYLHDFFISAAGDTLVLDGEAARLADLQRRLSLYRLRAKVTISPDTTDRAVFACFAAGAPAAFGLPEDPGAAIAFAGGAAFVDPRLAALGVRVVAPRETAEAALREAGFAPAAFADWDRLRLAHGIPDGSRDLPVEKAILLESGFDELHGVDWSKGCYIGQELTARTKYRGLVKKRLMPVTVEGALPEPGTIIRMGEAEAGEMRSGRDGIALALLRLEAVASGQALDAGGAPVVPRKPDWANF
ncbi:MAG: glycine cleavage system protein [Rhodospirillales bacterium]|nr:glycine cleavage system protein [Rhodospirillales bacterium]